MNGVGPAGGVQGIIAMRQQIIDRSSALQSLRDPQTVAPATAPQDGGGFAATLQNAVGQVNDAQRNAQELSAGYERGEVVDVAKVMLARQESGMAFEATLQVRNKLLSAYHGIMRMGV